MTPEAIYTSYNISYTEGDEHISCRATFRFGGKNGTTLVLNSPTKVQLDGETLKVDSSRFSGAYYQVDKPFASFKGEHAFTFFNANNSTTKKRSLSRHLLGKTLSFHCRYQRFFIVFQWIKRWKQNKNINC